jgi:hypothetical protein
MYKYCNYKIHYLVEPNVTAANFTYYTTFLTIILHIL